MKEEYISKSYNNGLVSVIIPLFNRESIIAITLDSIWNQKYRPIELIIVDDGSTDNSVNVVSNWMIEHSGDREFSSYLYKQTKSGAQRARNYGLFKAKGEYIQFIDSDDIISPSKIQSQVKAACSIHSNHIIHGPWCTFSEKNGKIYVGALNSEENGYYPFKSNDLILAWCRGGYEPPHTFLWPRKVIEDIGLWDERLHAYQDIDYLGRAFVNNYKLHYEPSGISFYRVHEPNDRISGSLSDKKIKSFFRVCKKITINLIRNNIFEKYRSALAERYYGIARKTAVSHIKYSKLAMKYYLLYKSESTKKPGTKRYRIISSIFGLKITEILSRILFKMKIPTTIKKNIKCINYDTMIKLYDRNISY